MRRKLLILLVFFLLVALIIFSFSELESTINTLKKANPLWLALALVVQVLWIVNLASTFQAIYRLFGLQESRWQLCLQVAAANFVNIVAPTAGVGGMAIFISDGRKRSHPAARIMVAGALFLFLDYLAFLCVLALGLIVLIRRDNLQASDIVASLILFVIASALAVLLYVGSHSARQLEAILAWAARFINWIVNPFLHRPYLSVERAHEFASEVAEGLAELRGRTFRLGVPFIYSLLNKTLLIVILLLVFIAFKVPYSAGTLVGGFSIGYLFLIVSPTPSGIGVVEGVLALALKSLRVEWSHAVLITLAYRAITFWFPLGLGAIAFRRLQQT
jgi:uncharacterized protein (TIRG00374 family)